MSHMRTAIMRLRITAVEITTDIRTRFSFDVSHHKDATPSPRNYITLHFLVMLTENMIQAQLFVCFTDRFSY